MAAFHASQPLITVWGAQTNLSTHFRGAPQEDGIGQH